MHKLENLLQMLPEAELQVVRLFHQFPQLSQGKLDESEEKK